MGEKKLLPHQVRVVNEANELAAKIKSLNEFIEFDDRFHEQTFAEQILMQSQLKAMMKYNACLSNRITLF